MKSSLLAVRELLAAGAVCEQCGAQEGLEPVVIITGFVCEKCQEST